MEEGMKPGIKDQEDAAKQYPNTMFVGNNDCFKLMTKFASVTYKKNSEGNVVTKNDGTPIIGKINVQHSTKGNFTGNGVVLHYSGLVSGIPITDMCFALGTALVPEDTAPDGWKIVSIGSKAHVDYLKTLSSDDLKDYFNILSPHISKELSMLMNS